ncbi:MAG: glycoside hydrolase family 3 protein [Pseudobacteriovorax sp.]|nr:glycoside hydrolase family 3 protein [Pseudobacteriovorax sp.]
MGLDAASAVLVAAYEGPRPTQAEMSFFESEQPAGVTLFRRNVPQNFSELRETMSLLQSLMGSSLPAIIAIDQEGGRVSRMRSPFPDLGPPFHIKPQDPSVAPSDLLENYGYILGSSLRSLGINTNFGPVCDILSNPDNIAIGDRCFGEVAEDVIARAGAFQKGMQASGVKGCLKHFPGQGDASLDTHLHGTVITASYSALKSREILPFEALLPHTSMIMMSHVIYQSVCSKPASLSERWVTDILRGELSYQGLVVTDDLNMKALPQDDQSWSELICEAVAIGSDLLLVCRDLDKCRLALQALRAKAKQSQSFSNKLELAAKRVSKLRKTLMVGTRLV